MKKVVLLLLIFKGLVSNSQTNSKDSLLLNSSFQNNSVSITENEYKLNYKKLIVPAGLITVGAISFAIPKMKEMDFDIRKEVYEHNPSKSTLDNYTQFAPAFIVYGLNFAGIEGKHNFRDRTIILFTSQAISTAIVIPSKYIIGEERPDKSNKMSFPSGHAAIAFSTAHFMFKEYKDTNYWLGISGYSFAVFTGIYRVINNKHWVTDVIAGAGVGILSTELAYWIYPKINSIFSKKSEKRQSMLMPFYQQKSIGISYQLTF